MGAERGRRPRRGQGCPLVSQTAVYGFREVPALAVTRAREIALISGGDSRCAPSRITTHSLTSRDN